MLEECRVFSKTLIWKQRQRKFKCMVTIENFSDGDFPPIQDELEILPQILWVKTLTQKNSNVQRRKNITL